MPADPHCDAVTAITSRGQGRETFMLVCTFQSPMSVSVCLMKGVLEEYTSGSEKDKVKVLVRSEERCKVRGVW